MQNLHIDKKEEKKTNLLLTHFLVTNKTSKVVNTPSFVQSSEN